MSVSSATAAAAVPPTARHAELRESDLKPAKVEAAAALLLIRKAIINDPNIGQSLDLAA